MLIKWIKLHNLRSYTNAEIELSNGSTLLSGDVGSGKSSILLAIEFGIFGIIKGEVSGNTLLRKGENNGSVELCMELEKNEIIIKRILKKKKDSITQESSYIIINGVKKELAPVELKSKILELLGYPMEMINKKNLIYRYTVYTPQEEMKRIIFENSEERLNTLRKVFGIDKYRRIRDNSMLLMKKLKEQCKELKGYLIDLDEKKKLQQQSHNKITLLKDELKPLEKSILEIKKELTLESNKFLEKKKKLEEYNVLKNKLSIINSELKSFYIQNDENNINIKREVEEIDNIKFHNIDVSKKELLNKDIIDTESKIINLKEKLSSTTEKQKNLLERINDVKLYISKNNDKLSTKNDLQKNIDNLKNNLIDKDKLNKDIEKKQNELSKSLSDQAILTQKNENAQAIISKIIKLAKCPLCLQTVDIDHKKEILSLQNKIISETKQLCFEKINSIENLKNEINLLKSKIKEHDANDTKLNKLILELESIKNIEIESLHKKDELKKSESILLEVNKELNNLNSDHIKELTEHLILIKEQLKKINDNETNLKIKSEKEKRVIMLKLKNQEIDKKIIELNTIKKDTEIKIEQFKGIDDQITKMEESINIKKDQLKNKEILIADKNARLSSLNDELTRIEKEISEKKLKQKIIHKKTQYIDWIEKSFVNIITMIEKNMLISLYNEFNSLFREWFNILIEDETISAKLDDDFTPLIQQNGYDIEIENLSGGEKTALALAYRLALNKVINDISSSIKTKDLIILDEPTDGFSEQQLDKIRDVLEKLQMNQIILVSHETKIETFVDKIIKITKTEHVSNIET
jgi:DNA repair protein SbcC/Rad50